MAESDRRLPVSLLVAALVAIAVVSMVVDRRAVLEGGRALPAWLGSVLDVAAPVQDAVHRCAGHPRLARHIMDRGTICHQRLTKYHH